MYSHNRQGQLQVARFLRVVTLSLVMVAAAELTSVLPAQAAPAWLSPVTISARDADRPQVVFDPEGNATVVWNRSDGATSRIEAAFRPAGGSFSDATRLSASGASSPQVALDPQGNAIAIWPRRDGTNRHIEAAFRPAGGSFGAAAQVSAAGQDAFEPQVSTDPQGNAIAVWSRHDGNYYRIEAAFRPAGGSFGAATQISSAESYSKEPQVDMDPQGNAIAVWKFYVGGAGDLIEAAFRPAGGSFGAATWLRQAYHAYGPQVVFDSQGNAIAIWSRYDGAFDRIEAAFRPAGGRFGDATELSATSAFSPQVVFDSQGNAIAIWSRYDGSYYRIEAAFRPAGGSFGAAAQVSAAGRDAFKPQVSTDPQGNAIALWSGGGRIEAAVRPAGGSFGAATQISAAGRYVARDPQVAVDSQGNAIAVWYESDSDGGDGRIHAAGYDAADPKLQNLSIPATGVAGAPVAFSVAPLDVWSAVPSTTWSFGDGTNTTGTQVTHAYTAPGSYPVSVTSTDAVGNSATATRTISISPAPPGGQVPPPPPGGSPLPDKVSPGLPPSPPAASPLSAPLPPTALGDTTVPIISSFTMVRSRFRVASEATPRMASRSVRPGRGRGSEFRYTLSESAQVKITIERSLEGRKSHSGCAKPTRKLRRKARCLRLEGVGALTRNANTGANATPFTGRIGTVALTPGPYRATIVATDKAENTSKPSQLSFTILSD